MILSSTGGGLGSNVKETMEIRNSMRSATDVMVIGHICLDIFPGMENLPPGQFGTLFQPGHLIEVGPATFSTGGAVSNTGLALHILGMKTGLMGKIGSDLFGQAILDIVRSHGRELAEGMLVDDRSSTSYTVVVNPPGSDRIFLHCPGANNTFRAADVRYDLVGETRLIHFGYPPLMHYMYADNGTELTDIFRRARELGVTTSLDMVYPDPASRAGRADWAEILKRVLPYTDIFLPSLEEYMIMVRPEIHAQWQKEGGCTMDDRADAEWLSELTGEMIAQGVAIAGLKLGHRGLFVRSGRAERLKAMGRACPAAAETWADRELWAPCFEVEVAGTTGSGDATIAGFLAALLRGTNLEEAMTVAVAVGACNVESADAVGGLRSWEKTVERVKKGWRRKAMERPGSEWQWEESCGIWGRRR